MTLRRHVAKANAVRGVLRNGAFIGPSGKFSKKGTLRDRFMALVDRRSKKCWRWTGSKDKYGYGRMKIDGQVVRAPRISYGLFVGPVPPGLHVLHSCDIRWCVNPAHLWVGNNKDNSLDAARKGRLGRHNKHRRCKGTLAPSAPVDAKGEGR